MTQKLRLRFILLSFFFLLPAVLTGQDTDPEPSQEEIQNHRNRLIQAGFLQEPADQLTSRAVNVVGYLEHASYTGSNVSVSTVDSRASDFRPNGSRFYIMGRDSENVAEYQLSSSWDIASASYVREFDISDEVGSSSQGSVANGLFIRDDGEMMWVLNRTEIWEYTLSTAWNVSSASQTGYKQFSELVRGHDIHFRSNGRVLYIDDRDLGAVFQYNLSTAWDVTTASLDNVLDISDRQQEVRGIQLSEDGERMFLLDTGARQIYEYYLATPHDVGSASFIGSFSVSSQASNPRGLTFRPDLGRFYVTDADGNRVYQYRILLADADESTITASSRRVPAFGGHSSTITVEVNDSNGEPIQGMDVTLSADGGSSQIETVQGTSDSNGRVKFEVTNTVPEQVTYRAQAGVTTLNSTVTVNFVTVDADESTVAADPRSVLAFGDIKSRITVTVRDDQGEPIERARVTLSALGGSSQIETVRGTSDGNGEAIFEVSNNTAEQVTYRATAEDVEINQTTTVTFFTVDPDESSVAVSLERVVADGTQESTITVTLRDEDGEVVEGVDVELNQGSNDHSEIRAVQPMSDENGEVIFTVSNNTAEQVTYRAVAGNVTITETVTVNFVAVDPNESTLEVSLPRVLANGEQESVITITLRADDGDVLEGVDVTLAQERGERADGSETRGDAEIEEIRARTDANGEAVFSILSTISDTEGAFIYSANAGGVTLAETGTVYFIPFAETVELGNNFPNPFSRETAIPLTLPRSMHVNLVVVNVLGAVVQTLVDEQLPAGYHEIPFYPYDLASGVYFYRAITDEGVFTEKMLLVR